jgi:hypothetical protein
MWLLISATNFCTDIVKSSPHWLLDRCTRPTFTAATAAHTESPRTLAAKSRSMVTMTSGFHSSGETAFALRRDVARAQGTGWSQR